MSNGRLSNTNDSDDTMPNVLEPQVTIIPQSSPTPPPIKTPQLNPLINHLPILTNPFEQARLQHNFIQKLNELSNTPLNLSHLDEEKRKNGHERREQSEEIKHDCGTATEEERLYFTAKRQHAITEHEAKMKILNMELRQKEEIFSLQKQLFLIELRLKMDFLEKASAKWNGVMQGFDFYSMVALRRLEVIAVKSVKNWEPLIFWDFLLVVTPSGLKKNMA